MEHNFLITLMISFLSGDVPVKMTQMEYNSQLEKRNSLINAKAQELVSCQVICFKFVRQVKVLLVLKIHIHCNLDTKLNF